MIRIIFFNIYTSFKKSIKEKKFNIYLIIYNILYIMQNMFLNNKCARIWAFDEMIDNNTKNNGNNFFTGLEEIKVLLLMQIIIY